MAIEESLSNYVMNQVSSLTLEMVSQLSGSVVLEFGATWCGYCQAAQPKIAAGLSNYPDVKHIKIEDGRGQRLGRQFSVKLWPTLVFLKDGVEIGRLVRPDNTAVIIEALSCIA